MFKNVGKSIKDRAKEYVFIRTTWHSLIGMIAGLLLMGYVDGPVFVAVIIGLGCGFASYFSAREKAKMMYAYGELVDCVLQIKTEISQKNSVAQLVASERDFVEEANNIKAVRDHSAGWTCPRCKKPNLAQNAYCQYCGIEAEFE